MKNITVILPVHKLSDEYVVMLTNSIKSVELFYEDVKLLIVHPTSISTELKKIVSTLSEKLEIKCLENKKDIGFISQVNLGIEQCDTEWFSILEVDDEYKPIWLRSIM
jgi:hypothetical protein